MRLSGEQVKRYLDDGFLLVEDVFTKEELQPVLDHFEVIVDDWVEKLHAGGELKNRYEGEDVYTRLASAEKEWPGAAALVTQRNSMFPALAELWNSNQLLDMVEQFLGPDIDGHPISIFRSKTPSTALMTVPWHQDAAYFVEGGEGTLQPPPGSPSSTPRSRTGPCRSSAAAKASARSSPIAWRRRSVTASPGTSISPRKRCRPAIGPF